MPPGPTVAVPVPFLHGQGYSAGRNIGENAHRRLFPTRLPMFVKCMVIIIYLESLKTWKKKIYSNESILFKIL